MVCSKMTSSMFVVATLLSVNLLSSLNTHAEGSCSSGDRCLGSSGYCSGGYTFRPTCVGGYCRCSNIPNRDYCTCLSIIGSCHITKDNSTALGTPTFSGQSQTTYSCVANENCRYNVHVIGNYEGNGRHGFGVQRTTGRTNVNLRVSGPNEGTKPLILVFVSYEPVTWILSIPNGVVIERILLGSYYLDDSSVTGYSSQSVLNVERLPYQTLPYGIGSDTGGGRTDELLEYVIGRFGPIASFSGSYRADSWTLNIQQNLLQSDCQQTPDSVTEQVHITTSSLAATNPTPSSNSETNPSSTPAPDSSCSSGDRCLGSSGYCSGGYTFRPTCVDGYCRCSNIPNRNYCTCLSIIGSCHITKDNSTALGIPTFRSQSQTTYSCVANENCRYNVHVIGNYEGNGRHGFGVQRTTGRTNVNLRVSGPNEGTKPLILVFVSYEPVTWILSIPNGVVIERILLGSYYLDDSSVTGYSSQSVLNVERLPYQTLPNGFGSDTGGGRTDELLEYVIGRFGPVASFSGSYRADSWTLNIQQNLLQSDCQQTLDSVTEQVHITTSSLAATNPTPSSNSETSPSSTPAPDSSPRIGDVRLSGGRCSGNLEIYVNALPYGERWYQICGRNFGDDEAEVVCRQLGCSTQNAVRRQASFGFYAYVFYISQGYDCTGSESSLSRCSRTSAQCILNSVDYGEANDHIAIRCQNPTPPVPPSVPTPSTSSQAPPSQQPNGDGSCSSGDRCVGSSGYCSGGYTFRPTCVDGYCRCSNIPNRDYCTCLSIIGNCHITKDNSTALGIPTFRSQSQTTYSCVANENCQYNVHVIGNYEGNGRHGFGVRRTTGRTNVNLRVSGPNEGTKPLILVFVSYEPVTWILSIPNGVVIERILLGSYYLDDSSVTGYSSQSVLNVERLPYQTLPNGFGSDIGGGRTDELLEYIIGRFGPVASFSGSYRADSWTLNIQQSLFRSDCRQPEISRPGSESISQVIGDVQLSNECSGELQMYESLQSGQGWYSICESSFSDANSKVVCRNLGCSIDGATSTMRVSQSFLPSTRAHIYCYGYESSLSHCELTNMSQCSSFQSRQSVHIECSSNNGDTLKEKTSKIAIFFIFTVILAMM